MTAILAPAQSAPRRSLTRLPCQTASHDTALKYSRGERKTAADERALTAVRKWDADQREEWDEAWHSYRLRTIAGLSKIWDGLPIDRVRAGDGIASLYERRAAIHLLLQPIILNCRQSGPCRPPSEPACATCAGRWSWADIRTIDNPSPVFTCEIRFDLPRRIFGRVVGKNC